jgi:hypothetical protein
MLTCMHARRRVPYLQQQLASYQASQHDSSVPHNLLADLLNEALDHSTSPETEALQCGGRMQAVQLSPSLSLVVSTAGQIGERMPPLLAWVAERMVPFCVRACMGSV